MAAAAWRRSASAAEGGCGLFASLHEPASAFERLRITHGRVEDGAAGADDRDEAPSPRSPACAPQVTQPATVSPEVRSAIASALRSAMSPGSSVPPPPGQKRDRQRGGPTRPKDR